VGGIEPFDASADKDGVYTIVIKPDTGDPFILRASARDGDKFTGVSPAGMYGTTAADASGDGAGRVRVAYRLEGHPVNILMRTLTSTGAGTNGSYDEEPQAVGYGVPEDLTNPGDLATWAAVLSPPSDPFAVDLAIADLGTTESGARPTTLTEGMREIQRRLGQAGIWLVFRQGHYVVRGLQDLYDDPEVSGLTITLGKVVPGSIIIEQYAAERSEEWAGVRVLTAVGGASIDETLPPRLMIPWFNKNLDLDCTTLIQSDGPGGEVPEKIASRMRDWVVNRLLRIRMTLGGLHWLQLCPGDLVAVDLSAGASAGIDIVDLAVRIAHVTGEVQAWPINMMVERMQCLLPAPAVTFSLLLAPRRSGGEDEPGGTVPALP
jgi:hypothetical protein